MGSHRCMGASMHGFVGSSARGLIEPIQTGCLGNSTNIYVNIQRSTCTHAQCILYDARTHASYICCVCFGTYVSETEAATTCWKVCEEDKCARASMDLLIMRVLWSTTGKTTKIIRQRMALPLRVRSEPPPPPGVFSKSRSTGVSNTSDRSRTFPSKAWVPRALKHRVSPGLGLCLCLCLWLFPAGSPETLPKRGSISLARARAETPSGWP